jgi:hypothetical protein
VSRRSITFIVYLQAIAFAKRVHKNKPQFSAVHMQEKFSRSSIDMYKNDVSQVFLKTDIVFIDIYTTSRLQKKMALPLGPLEPWRAVVLRPH